MTYKALGSAYTIHISGILADVVRFAGPRESMVLPNPLYLVPWG